MVFLWFSYAFPMLFPWITASLQRFQLRLHQYSRFAQGVIDHFGHRTASGFTQNLDWLVVWNPLKNISQLGWLFPIYGKIKNVPNHQPVYICIQLHTITYIQLHIILYTYHYTVFYTHNTHIYTHIYTSASSTPIKAINTSLADGIVPAFTCRVICSTKGVWPLGVKIVKSSSWSKTCTEKEAVPIGGLCRRTTSPSVKSKSPQRRRNIFKKGTQCRSDIRFETQSSMSEQRPSTGWLNWWWYHAITYQYNTCVTSSSMFSCKVENP